MTQQSVVPLSEIANVTAGTPAPQGPNDFVDNGIPFIRMQDVGRYHHCSDLVESVDHVSEESAKRNHLRLFPKGSLLIPKSGASVNLNHRAMLARDAYVVSHLAVAMPDTTKIVPEYLYYWSLQYDPRSQAQVTSLPSLPLSLIKEAKVPLPPVVEQRRIVDILKRADGIRRLRKQAQDTARQLIPALFIDMFGDPATNPKGWPIGTIGDCITQAQYGTSKKAHEHDSGLPIIRMGNVLTNGDLDLQNLKYVKLDEKDQAKYQLETGDILFNRTNSKDLVGKTGMWKGDFEAVAASYFIVARTDRNKILPTYLWIYMNTPYMKRRLFDTARGAIGQSNINAKELKALTIPIPPIELQERFEVRLEGIQSITVQQEAAQDSAESSFQSLLHRAFSGIL